MENGRASRWATAPDSNSGERAALRVRLPPLPLSDRIGSTRAPGRAVRHQCSKLDRRVQLPRGTLGNRLTGRLPGFEPGGGGSNPPSRTPGQLRLVVTPRSERGGRWFDSSPRNSRLGRQLADHSRSEREMLRVRIPPEPSISPALVEQSGVLATLSRWRPRVQIPSGAPCSLGCVGRALASPGGRNPPASGCAGSTPARRTWSRTRRFLGPVVYRTGHRPLWAERRVRLPSGLLARNRSRSKGPHNPGVAGAQPALIRPAFPDRHRGLGLVARRAGPHVPWSSGTTPLLQRGNGGSSPSGTTF